MVSVFVFVYSLSGDEEVYCLYHHLTEETVIQLKLYLIHEVAVMLLETQ